MSSSTILRSNQQRAHASSGPILGRHLACWQISQTGIRISSPETENPTSRQSFLDHPSASCHLRSCPLPSALQAPISCPLLRCLCLRYQRKMKTCLDSTCPVMTPSLALTSLKVSRRLAPGSTRRTVLRLCLIPQWIGCVQLAALASLPIATVLAVDQVLDELLQTSFESDKHHVVYHQRFSSINFTLSQPIYDFSSPNDIAQQNDSESAFLISRFYDEMMSHTIPTIWRHTPKDSTASLNVPPRLVAG